MNDSDCVAFLQWALPRMGLRWAGFRRVRRQVCKRVSKRLRELGLEGLNGYRLYLEEHPGEWTTLDYACRITISRFHRDRRVFDVLSGSILPGLARAAAERGEPSVACWSVGCASGEEPYSVSLAWALGASKDVRGPELEIVATDIDAHLLERARAGCYRPGTLRELPPGWIAAAFEPVDDSLRLRPEFRERVEFVRQDVRKQMPAGPFDLVLCRNLVLTYFEPSLQTDLLGRMLGRLEPGGHFVIGAHETLPPDSWPLDRPYGALPIYRKVGPG